MLEPLGPHRLLEPARLIALLERIEHVLDLLTQGTFVSKSYGNDRLQLNLGWETGPSKPNYLAVDICSVGSAGRRVPYGVHSQALPGFATILRSGVMPCQYSSQPVNFLQGSPTIPGAAVFCQLLTAGYCEMPGTLSAVGRSSPTSGDDGDTEKNTTTITSKMDTPTEIIAETSNPNLARSIGIVTMVS